MKVGEQNTKELKIHFIWLIWKLNNRLELRERIKKASEDEKEQNDSEVNDFQMMFD